MSLVLYGLLLAMAVITFFMVSSLLFRNAAQTSRYHIMLCLALLFYSIGYFMEITAQNEAQAFAALQIENLGIPAIGPFYLLCIMQLCDFKPLRNWMGYLASAHVMFIFMLVVLNDYHHLYYTSISIEFGTWTYVTMGKGVFYFYNQVVSVLCVLPAFVLLGKRYVTWTKSMRRRMSLILLGSLVTLAGNVINVFGLLDTAVDITVIAFGITMICFFIAVRRNRLYELEMMSASRATQTMEDAMIVLDVDGGLIYYNESAGKLFPALNEVNTNTPASKINGLPKLFEGPLLAGSQSIECGTSKGERHFRCSVNDIDGDGWSIVMRDITHTVMLTRRLEELADIDDLTRIYNRRYFLELMEYELVRIQRHPESAALIMFDIDYFKKVNDTYGHAAGDETLLRVAGAVRGILRASDLFGRYGGEEFLIFCPNTDKEEARHLAERIRQMIAGTEIRYGDITLHVNASFGITEILPGDEIDALVNNADEAMYRAKNTGRNCVVVYDKDMMENAPA